MVGPQVAASSERLDDTTDSKTKFGVKADPDAVAKPTARRGKAKKVKVEDAEEDVTTMASAPTALEPKKEEPKPKPITRRSRNVEDKSKDI